MAYYVPGTEETDLKKVIMSLQLIAAGLSSSDTAVASLKARVDNIEAAWVAYTPAYSAVGGSGVITSATATGKYRKNGKTVFVKAALNLVTASGSSAYLTLGLPPGIPVIDGLAVPLGREQTAGGILAGAVIGSDMGFNYNNGAIVALSAGQSFALNMVYETS